MNYSKPPNNETHQQITTDPKYRKKRTLRVEVEVEGKADVDPSVSPTVRTAYLHLISPYRPQKTLRLGASDA